MSALPSVLVDRLPASLWRPGNLRLGGRLHFCYGGSSQRTVDWAGREVASGKRLRTEEMERHEA